MVCGKNSLLSRRPLAAVVLRTTGQIIARDTAAVNAAILPQMN